MDENPFTVVAILVLMSAGAAFVFHSVAKLREIGRVRRTPLSKIGAAPAGWAAHSGLAKTRREINDHVPGSPRVWWRCVVQEADTETLVGWHDVKKVACPESFYLDDGTGTVTVDPRGAEPHVGDLEERIVELTSENHVFRREARPSTTSYVPRIIVPADLVH